MSQQYDNTNRGVLFTNDRKETDNHPDMKGSLNINGVEHWFSAWWKDGQKGEFLSLSIGDPKEQQGRAAPSQRQAAPEQPRRGTRPAAQPARRPAPPQGDYDSDGVPF